MNQHTDYGRAIEDARRDLDVFKKAYMASERAKQEAEERFEKEKRYLLEELNCLRVRCFASLSFVFRRN
jgi:hypothetical protein